MQQQKTKKNMKIHRPKHLIDLNFQPLWRPMAPAKATEVKRRAVSARRGRVTGFPGRSCLAGDLLRTSGEPPRRDGPSWLGGWRLVTLPVREVEAEIGARVFRIEGVGTPGKSPCQQRVSDLN